MADFNLVAAYEAAQKRAVCDEEWEARYNTIS